MPYCHISYIFYLWNCKAVVYALLQIKDRKMNFFNTRKLHLYEYITKKKRDILLLAHDKIVIKSYKQKLV